MGGTTVYAEGRAVAESLVWNTGSPGNSEKTVHLKHGRKGEVVGAGKEQNM